MSESNSSTVCVDDSAFCWERRVEFCETDAAGIVHFSSFFLYMEQAEHALFRAIGSTIFPIDFHRHSDAGPAITWPRVRCECEYLAPARFEETLTVRVVVERMGVKSLTYTHQITRGDQAIARGRIISVCSTYDPTTGKLVGHPIPTSLRESLGRFVSPHP